eukprot:268492_1
MTISTILPTTSVRTVEHATMVLQATHVSALSDTRAITARSKRSFSVELNRDPDIQKDRLKLPVCAEEQEIMESIMKHDVTIICGETGSGKTTQVPQFLYEAGFGHPESRPGLIGVTEPRRVAAVSMSARVGRELGVPEKVAYQIRYDSQVNEAHERNINPDVRVGLLSRIVPLRRKISEEKVGETLKPLKLVIMSATLRVDDFCKNEILFPVPPPVMEVESRQFPVSIHFNKTTPIDDYVTETFDKISKIHKRLPPGGILVFMTGRQEIEQMCTKLRNRFQSADAASISRKDTSQTKKSEDKVNEEAPDYSAHVPSLESDSDAESDSESGPASWVGCGAVRVLPLYAMLPTDKQMRVFEEAQEGVRLIVISTNVAETSLTIPGIKYVVDTGKEKRKVFDEVTGMSSFKVDWISKASADQRSGRSGRVGPGHCYRLYSSAVFDRNCLKDVK